MHDPDQLATFMAIAEAGAFSEAARRRGLRRSRASQRARQAPVFQERSSQIQDLFFDFFETYASIAAFERAAIRTAKPAKTQVFENPHDREHIWIFLARDNVHHSIKFNLFNNLDQSLALVCAPRAALLPRNLLKTLKTAKDFLGAFMAGDRRRHGKRSVSFPTERS